MITFKPDAFYKTHFVPPIYLTGFQVHNKELGINEDSRLLKKSIIYTDRITLPYDQSSFSIDFAAISFTSPEMTEYSYIMGGLDKEWTYLKSNRKVYFTNLEPGTYTFKVKAGNNGKWNKEIKTLTIQITPPFWATRLAYFVYALVIILLLYYLISVYHNMQENKKEKEIYEAKFDFFTNIAHEIKTPLTLIKGPVENLSEIVNEIPEIKEDVVTLERNTNRLVNLTNQILDFRQTERKGFSLDFTQVNLNELLQEAYLTFEPLSKKRRLNYSMKLPTTNVFIMADAEALNKIFSNLFSNAVKYANKDVSVEMQPLNGEDEYLTIEFKNDGFVVPDDLKEKIFEPFYRLKETVKQKGTGIGLALARSLVELHNGALYMKKAEEKMNVFILRLPYFEKDKKKERKKQQVLQEPSK
jgi:signal transduction histidine kinase